MLCKKRKNKKLKRVAALIAIASVLCYLYLSAVNLIFEYGGKDFQYYVSNCSYYAVKKCIDGDFDFSTVCEIQKNSSGEVAFIKTNSLMVNYAAQKLSLDCYEYLSEYTKKGASVPLGAFSGIRIFSGTGKKINVKLNVTVSVECKIYASFTSVGINQTRQVLYAVIHSDITVFSLFKSKYYEGNIQVALFDNLIVGKVPEVYLQSGFISGGSASGKIYG